MGHNEAGHAGQAKELITVRMRTAGWWPPSSHARLHGSSPRRGLRATVLAVVMIAAGMTAGSAPAAIHPPAAKQIRASTTTGLTGADAIWTSDPGGSFTATGAAGVADTKTAASVTCTGFTLGGTLATEVENGAGIGSIASAALTGCTLGKVPVKVTMNGLPWKLNATGFGGTGTGVVTGTISGIDLAVTGSGCSATLDGTAAGADNGVAAVTYTNPADTSSLGKLALSPGGNLHWWAVSGCSGKIGDGDPGQASGSATIPGQILTQFCFPYREGIALNPHFPVPKPPPGAKQIPTPPEPACAFVAGFTNAQKLNEAAFIGPAYADLVIALAEYEVVGKSGIEYLQLNNAGLPQYHGLSEFPPARATLLGFGFMPVTASLQLSEIGTLNAIFIQRAAGHYGCTQKAGCGLTTIKARLDLHISDVNVNGTPLNVGPDCQTATPFTVTLKGKYPAYIIDVGGPLTGTVKIPSFKDCNDDGDNLDSIFTASVSGPGNQTLLTQGTPCGPPPGVSTFPDCPPPVPTPKH
jgi:hypothetical protein